MYERGKNYYQLMGVKRDSNPLEIKRAYKKMSLELHPDKNKSPTAAEDFARLKDAYDVSNGGWKKGDEEMPLVWHRLGFRSRGEAVMLSGLEGQCHDCLGCLRVRTCWVGGVRLTRVGNLPAR